MKGAPLEREVCRDFSLWLSGGKDDSWFWRASQSGGRATQRAKKGKKTEGHCSDIAATCPKATRLTRFVSIEIKHGYKLTCLYDLLDRKEGQKGLAPIQKFIKQAELASKRAGTPHWAIVHRRHGRKKMIIAPVEFFQDMGTSTEPRATFLLLTKDNAWTTLRAMELESFLRQTNPNTLRRNK